MNIPYYLIKDAPRDSGLPDWVRSNSPLIQLIASHILGRLEPERPGTVGRPRIDCEVYVDCLRRACSGHENAKPRKEVIRLMQAVRPVSDTAGREILKRFCDDGIMGSERGECSWSPTMVWWVGSEEAPATPTSPTDT